MDPVIKPPAYKSKPNSSQVLIRLYVRTDNSNTQLSVTYIIFSSPLYEPIGSYCSNPPPLCVPSRFMEALMPITTSAPPGWVQTPGPHPGHYVIVSGGALESGLIQKFGKQSAPASRLIIIWHRNCPPRNPHRISDRIPQLDVFIGFTRDRNSIRNSGRNSGRNILKTNPSLLSGRNSMRNSRQHSVRNPMRN